MTTAIYHAEATRDGRFWLVAVPEIDQVTQARTIAEIEVMARDLIAITEDVAPDSFQIDVHISMPAEAQKQLEEATRLRAVAAETQNRAAQYARDAALQLHNAGIPLRDVGALLGVSYQRAHQLAQPFKRDAVDAYAASRPAE